MPILDVRADRRAAEVPAYPAGTWGPDAAAQFYTDQRARGREPNDRSGGTAGRTGR
jgi:glucose-6-phosphate 1-dehydrogenase